MRYKKCCEAGAIGAAIGEIIADQIKNGRYSFELNESGKTQIETWSKLVAGTISAYAGYDVNVAANSADRALKIMLYLMILGKFLKMVRSKQQVVYLELLYLLILECCYQKIRLFFGVCQDFAKSSTS